MKNPFKNYKVTEDVTIVYDTYKEGSYTRNKTLKIAKDTIINGDKITKGENKLISFEANELGVDELVQIPAEKTERQTPWGLIAAFVILIVGGVVYFVKRK